MSEDTIDLKENGKEIKETLSLEKSSPFTPVEQGVFIGSTDTAPNRKYFNIKELIEKAAAGDPEAYRALLTPLAIQHNGLTRDEVELKRKQVKGYKGTSFLVFDAKSQIGLNNQGLTVRIMLNGLSKEGVAEPVWKIRVEDKDGKQNYFGDDIKKLELKQGTEASGFLGRNFKLEKELKKGKEENGSEYYYRVLSMAPAKAEQVQYQKAA